ncbi:hypothetical protein CJ739_3757 [Mariniflexile rhizosphaerae]|nr:hypothetical protein CJ739_3757 [Mariniflexile sp. TRM1-10]
MILTYECYNILNTSYIIQTLNRILRDLLNTNFLSFVLNSFKFYHKT